MRIDPAKLNPADRYKLLIGAVVPRPIAFVSTVSPAGPDGTRSFNLAPFSFFNAVASQPMTMLFCPANTNDGHEKDTLRNAKPTSEGGTGEFVVNIVPHAIARQMASCAEPLAYGQSEWELSKLTQAPSDVVLPPRVRECPVAFECRTLSVTRLAPGQPGGGNIVLGQVVAVWINDDLVNDRLHVDGAKLDAIGRMGGGGGYCTTRDRLEIPPGRAALSTN
jgi:flavin reductase (DIM6/NTAB) family NADH-FMN oxidoreductase RutF